MFSSVLKKSIAAAATGAVVLQSMSTIQAEETSTPSSKNNKLSIYDDETTPKRIVIESPTKLEEHVAYAQKYANERLNEGKAHVDIFHGHIQSFENDVRGTIDEIISKDEEIFPNAVYIGVAALAGTVIARNRSIVLRFLTSTALATGASFYFLPLTTHNLGMKLEKLEHKHPELGKIHDSINESMGGVRKEVDTVLSSLRGQLDQGKEMMKQQVSQVDSDRSSPAVDDSSKKE